MSTKDDWKQTGKELGHAFKGLGKTILKTAKAGADKAVEWAERDDAAKEKKSSEEDK